MKVYINTIIIQKKVDITPYGHMTVPFEHALVTSVQINSIQPRCAFLQNIFFISGFKISFHKNCSLYLMLNV